MRIVIKFAGALLEDDATVRSLAQQVAALAQQGHEILVVHGGGRLFTATLKRMAIESKFIAGLRVTDRETRDVAVMVFAGLLNKKLTAAISAEGQPAIGISAADARCFVAEPMVHNEVEGSLGFVGYLTGLNVRFIDSLWREGLVPVAPCLGMGSDNELYNINADHMAAASAEDLSADELIYLADVAGVLNGERDQLIGAEIFRRGRGHVVSIDIVEFVVRAHAEARGNGHEAFAPQGVNKPDVQSGEIAYETQATLDFVVDHGLRDETPSVRGRNADCRLALRRNRGGQLLIQQTGEYHDGHVARFAVGDAQAGDELAFDGHALEGGSEKTAAAVHDENFMALLRERRDLLRERAHRGVVFEQCSCEFDYDSH